MSRVILSVGLHLPLEPKPKLWGTQPVVKEEARMMMMVMVIVKVITMKYSFTNIFTGLREFLAVLGASCYTWHMGCCDLGSVVAVAVAFNLVDPCELQQQLWMKALRKMSNPPQGFIRFIL